MAVRQMQIFQLITITKLLTDEISQSISQWQSLSPQSNICGQRQSLPQWSNICCSTLMVGFQRRPQIIHMGGREWQQGSSKYCITTTKRLTDEISQSISHWQSLSPQSNICRQRWSLPQWSNIWCSTLMVGFQRCPQILDKGGREWQQGSCKSSILLQCNNSYGKKRFVIQSFVLQYF